MPESINPKQMRIDAKIEEIRRGYDVGINDLLKEINRARLKGKGKITEEPVRENASLRWTLAWKEERKVSYQLNIVINIEDDGRDARVGRVWVHRRASTSLDYDGHTPTTRMRRLTALSMQEIKDAIDAEWS
ncbi:MAG: hypothetical protein KGJ80_21430 [Chloroflexota bacterium]|nr:hypothetical protein [Chloroflexota bacterium]